MSDLKGIEVHDLLGLSKPLDKLIETVSSGIGMLYKPFYVKRMAKAKAAEIEIVSSAINDSVQLPIQYQNGDIAIDATNLNELARRAQNRMLFQEIKKQQNIEAVVDVAYTELEKVETVSDTPVESDWINVFFDSIANVSTEQMQLLWGRLLAGEIKKPGSFSLRTLGILKNLSSNEAEIFKGITPYILRCRGDSELSDYFLMDNKDAMLAENYGIPFVQIMLLNEAGLISENNLISISFDLKPNQPELIQGVRQSIIIKNIGKDLLSVYHSAYFLTEAGKELFPIALDVGSQDKAAEYTAKCLEEIRAHGISGKSDSVTFQLVKN